MWTSRRLVFAVVGLVAAAAAIFVLDDYTVRKHVKRTMSTKRSTVTEEDRAWWERQVGPVPGVGAPDVDVILPGITGGPALDGNRFYPNGEDGEDGGAADARGWEHMGAFEAVELRDPAGQLRGRLLLSNGIAAYRLTDLGPLAFFERDAVVSPPDVVDNPLESKQWTRRPRWGRWLAAEAIGLAIGLALAWLVTTREAKRLRIIAARRAAAAPIRTGQVLGDALSDHCPCCGHDLRATDDERCGECGSHVGPPGSRARLELADPRWLRRVWLGRSVLSGTAAVVSALLLAQTLLHPVGFAVPRLESSYVDSALEIIEATQVWGLPFVALGAILFVSPDPRERQLRRSDAVGRWVRIAAFFFLALAVLRLLPQFAIGAGGFTLWVVIALGSPVALAILAIGAVRQAERLAKRLGAAELAHRCARRRLRQIAAAVFAVLALWVHVAIVWMLVGGYLVAPTWSGFAILMDIVPSLTGFLLVVGVPGPLRELGLDWRVALATARRARPSGT